MNHDRNRRKAAVNAILHGGLTGFLSGYIVKTISGALAIIAGSTIILYEVATNVKWSEDQSEQFTEAVEDFRNYLSQLPGTRLISGGVEYARSNKCYVTSFVGGFLIGFGLPDIAKSTPMAMNLNAQLVLDCRELISP